MQWFRFYSEVLNDPKVQLLDPVDFKIWVNCLCLASQNNSRDGNIGTVDAVSFAFRETLNTVSSAFHTLTTIGLLETDNETFHIPKWAKRQYKSDVSTERVKRFRKRHETVSETAPDTDTDTDTELSPKGESIDATLKSKGKSDARRKHELPNDFIPDAETLGLCSELNLDANTLLDEIRDWAKSKRPRYADWQAVFRNSARRSAKSRRAGFNGNPNASGRQTAGIVAAGIRVANRYSGKA